MNAAPFVAVYTVPLLWGQEIETEEVGTGREELEGEETEIVDDTTDDGGGAETTLESLGVVDIDDENMGEEEAAEEEAAEMEEGKDENCEVKTGEIEAGEVEADDEETSEAAVGSPATEDKTDDPDGNTTESLKA